MHTPLSGNTLPCPGKNMLVCAEGDIVSGNGLMSCESGMATEKLDGSGRTCSYEKRMSDFFISWESLQNVILNGYVSGNQQRFRVLGVDSSSFTPG